MSHLSKPTCFKLISFTLFVLYVSSALGQISAIDWKSLKRGEVIVEEVTDGLDTPGVKALFMVKGTREEIWATLLDYDNFPKFFKGIEKLKVLEQSEKGAKVEFWADAVLMDLRYILYRDYAEPNYYLTWQRVGGDLKDIHGSWQILDTDNPDQKLLIYESYVDIGFSMVTWMVRQGAKRKAEEMGYRLQSWLEGNRKKAKK